jgi:dihydroorotase
VEHTHAHPVRSVADLEEKRAHLVGRANVDHALAAHVWPDTIPRIRELAGSGITFFKIFTCDTHGVPGLDTAQLSTALDAIGDVGGTALIHNEDQALTAEAEGRLRADRRLDPGLLIEWRSRDAELVAVATTAAVALESGARVSFAHVSHPAVLDVITFFRTLGANLAAEACPQYFALDEDEVVEQGALRKFTPPARIRNDEERSAMWRAVAEGRFSFFSTDHAPSTLAQKTAGDFWDAPFGLPGLDTTLPFLIDAALAGRMTMSEVVRLYATGPAAWYRLPKGSLDVGADADQVLIDPAGSWTVDDTDIISKAGWSPYSGRTFRGRVVATFLRGTEIARDGVAHDRRDGRFVVPAR